MKKTGYAEINYKKENIGRVTCQSCKAIATKRVTFEDLYGKLVVSLCEECADKNYFELILQGRFSWPVKGDAEV